MALDAFYFCYVEGKGIPQFIHPSWESAQKEATRLAQLPANDNKKVFILQPVGYLKTKDKPVEWHDV